MVTELGGLAVSLADVVGPFFVTRPDEMFAVDRFHPSGAGYRRTAKAVLPSVLVALSLAEELPQLAAAGVTLVPLSTVVTRRSKPRVRSAGRAPVRVARSPSGRAAALNVTPAGPGGIGASIGARAGMTGWSPPRP